MYILKVQRNSKLTFVWSLRKQNKNDQNSIFLACRVHKKLKKILLQKRMSWALKLSAADQICQRKVAIVSQHYLCACVFFNAA